MGIENYVAIALVYGIGTYAAYRLGYDKGGRFALAETIRTIAKMSGNDPQAIVSAMIKFRKGDKHAAIS